MPLLKHLSVKNIDKKNETVHKHNVHQPNALSFFIHCMKGVKGADQETNKPLQKHFPSLVFA